jgi:hypothetical protein
MFTITKREYQILKSIKAGFVMTSKDIMRHIRYYNKELRKAKILLYQLRLFQKP